MAAADGWRIAVRFVLALVAAVALFAIFGRDIERASRGHPALYKNLPALILAVPVAVLFFGGLFSSYLERRRLLAAPPLRAQPSQPEGLWPWHHAALHAHASSTGPVRAYVSIFGWFLVPWFLPGWVRIRRLMGENAQRHGGQVRSGPLPVLEWIVAQWNGPSGVWVGAGHGPQWSVVLPDAPLPVMLAAGHEPAGNETEAIRRTQLFIARENQRDEPPPGQLFEVGQREGFHVEVSPAGIRFWREDVSREALEPERIERLLGAALLALRGASGYR